MRLMPRREWFARERVVRLVIRHALPIGIFISIALIVNRKALQGSGIFLNNDVFRPLDLGQYSGWFYPMWNDTQSVPNLTRLPQALLLLPLIALARLFGLDSTQFLKVEYVVTFVFLGLSMFYVARYLLEEGRRSAGFDFETNTSALLAGVFFAWNGFVLSHVFHPMMVLSFAFAPLFLLALYLGLLKARPYLIVLAGLLWSLMCGGIHWIVYGGILAIIVLVWVLARDVPASRGGGLRSLGRRWTAHLGLFGLLVGSFAVFSFYWILPGYIMGSTARYGYVLTAESLSTNYKGIDIWNFLSLDPSQLTAKQIFSTNSPLLSSSTTVVVFGEMGLLLLGIAMAGFLFKRRRGLKIMLLALIVVAFAQTTMMTYWPDTGTWFILQAPLHSLYGWAFKTPKFIQLLFIAIPFLLALSVHDVFSWLGKRGLSRRQVKGSEVCVVGVVLLLILLPSWPLATGDYNGNLVANQLPPEFNEVFDWLSAQKGDFKVLWVPDYNNGEVDWNKGMWTIRNVIAASSPKSTFYFQDRSTNPSGYGINLLRSLFSPDLDSPILFGNSTVSLGMILYPMGIKYVIFHDDNATRGNETLLLEGLKRQTDMELVKQVGILYVFENTFSPEGQVGGLYAVGSDVLVYGGLSSMGTLYSTPGFDPSRSVPIYGEQTHLDLTDISDQIDTVVFDGEADLDRMALSFVDKASFLIPFDATLYGERGSMVWSKRILEDMTRPIYVRQSKYTAMDWAYDSDLVFTWGEGQPLDEPSSAQVIPLLHLGFEQDPYPFNSTLSAGGFQLIPSNRSTEGMGSLKGILEVSLNDNRTYTASSLALPVTAGHGTYKVSLDLAATNANKLQVRARFLDEKGKVITKVFLITRTGNFDFIHLEKMVDLPSTVRAMDLSVLAERPSTSSTRWWLDNASLGLLEQEVRPNRISMPFTVTVPGDHEVLIRALQGPKCGQLGVLLDDRPIANMSTRGASASLVWTDLGRVDLSRGDHDIAVDNLEGFNALNVVAVVPSAAWEECLQRTKGLANGTVIMQSIEAEDLDGTLGAQVLLVAGTEGSRGGVLSIAPGGMASARVAVINNQSTSLFIRTLGAPVNGTVRVSIGGMSWTFDASGIGKDGWISILDLDLAPGEYVLTTEVLPSRPVLFREDFEGADGQPWSGWADWTVPRKEWNLSLGAGEGGASDVALELTTNSSNAKLMSNVRGPDLPVVSPVNLTLSFFAKAQNANASHAKLMGLNVTSGKWDQLAIIAQIKGDAAWRRFSKDIQVPPGYSSVRLVLNAGIPLDAAQGNATVWYDDIELVEKVSHGPLGLDVLHMVNGASISKLEDAFHLGTGPLIEYIGHPAPNRIEVEVNATGPATIVLREAYDDMWVLKDPEGRIYRSVPVAGMLNGFLVNGTGNMTYTIEYRPQAMFELGMAITLTALAVLCVALVASYLKRRGIASSSRRPQALSVRGGRASASLEHRTDAAGSKSPGETTALPGLDLSIVIPAFNEEDRIGRTLGDYLQHFEALYGERFEIVVITDGCVDRTCEVIASVGSPRLRHFDHPKRLGKGGAILEGFKHSRGRVVCFVDADGSTPPDQLELLIGTLADTGCDAVIGSRYNGGGTSGKRLPLSRRLASRGFNIMVRALFRLPYSDTQCGAKVLRREAAEEVSDGLELTDWAFDVNLLYNARLHGLDVREVGIRWEDTDGSKLKMRRVVPKMFMSVIRLRCLHSNFRWLVQNRWARAVAGLVYGHSGASR
jgi:hypothetical protein